MRKAWAILLATTCAMAAQAAPPASKGPVTLSNDKPVAVSSDTLEVLQDKHQAIFSGNVIATQGPVNMRADKMIVFYTSNSTPNGPKTTAPNTQAATAQGIERIEARGNVIFTNPTDTAKGDAAVYNVAAQTLDLTGQVLLTRDKNVLKGTRMHYDLQTSRSVLTAAGGPVTGGGGRVHGLFVPNAKPVKPAPASNTGTP